MHLFYSISLFVTMGVYGLAQAGTLNVIRTIPHSGYSEGLDFHDGYLWHALPKKIVRIDPKDGTVQLTYKPATEYSESISWFKGNLWNVSFHDNGIYKGFMRDGILIFKQVGQVPEKHAWGITHNDEHLIVTGNYSPKLYFLHPGSLKIVKTLETPVNNLEDLAWDGEGIWSSSFTEHRGKIFKIDPKTGEVPEFYALPETAQCPVIDGMAFDGKNLWVTGKHCTEIYYIKRPSQRKISSDKSPKKKAAKQKAKKRPAPQDAKQAPSESNDERLFQLNSLGI